MDIQTCLTGRLQRNASKVCKQRRWQSYWVSLLKRKKLLVLSAIFSVRWFKPQFAFDQCWYEWYIPVALHKSDFIVEQMSSFDQRLDKGFLYEVRSGHPISDCVGYLNERQSNTFYVVFVQISLQSYDRHVKISNIFFDKRSMPSELKNSWSKTLFSFYSKFAQKHLRDDSMYISPEDTKSELVSDVLSKLQDHLQPIKLQRVDMHVGKLSSNSSFTTRMVSFLTWW